MLGSRQCTAAASRLTARTACVVMGARYQNGMPILNGQIDWISSLTSQGLDHKSRVNTSNDHDC